MSSEIFLYNRFIKKNSNFNMWLFFPGPESFAMSSLGYLWLFKELDSTVDINIERVYSDTKNTLIMRDKLDLIGMSFTFDMDFVHIFDFLKKNNYAFESKKRLESDPLIYTGGPVVTANPVPYKNIFDFFVIGDGEDINVKVIDIIQKGKNANKNKSEILYELSGIEGIYVPGVNKKVTKLTKRLAQCIYTPILSEKAFFPNTFILEVERGCANRCGFCLASYMNLPIRFVPYEEIIETIELGLKHTNKIALLGAQVTAHPRFTDIIKHIENKIDNGEDIQMSVSSLRVDSFKPEIVSVLVKAGQKNLTLAIEAGSERLRKVINKNLTENQIFEAIETAKKCGLHGIKFYAMLGLPTENDDDIREIVNLSRKIKEKYKGFDISFGFSTFVPKANTPFQWFGREDEKTLEKKSNFLKKELHKLGVQVNISSAKWDYYQAVLSRGDENLAPFLIEVHNNGAKIGAFRKSAKELNINTDYYSCETYDYSKELPWDFIERKPGKEFLIEESKRLISYSGT